jgi:cobalt-zinc-cadmium efflux system outer membrane protein
MKFINVILAITFLFRLKLGFSADKCGELKTPKDILDCAMENHPDLIRGRRAVHQSELFKEEAGQIPNPEIEFKATYGKSEGDQISNNELDLPFTIETGGKRSSRIGNALAEKDQVSSEFLKTKEEVYIFVLKTLHRIRQIRSELKILEESLETFSKIQRQYGTRPRLGPEHEVSLNVFQLAEGDYKLRKSFLETEETRLEKRMTIALGMEFPHNDSVLLGRIEKWPIYLIKDRLLKGSDFKISEAELKVAQSNLELEKSESWPDLKIGPTIQSISEGPLDWKTYGINLSIALPIFNVNAGGRAVAKAGLMKAEKSFELRKIELNQFRNILITQYQKTVKSLEESVSLSGLEIKHKSIERQFSRGLIPSTLVIEAHRQMVDFTTSQNEQELLALEALLRLRVLDGTIFEENFNLLEKK